MKIYDIVGNLVIDFGKRKGTDTIEWDAKNDSGDLLPSGVYILHISGEGINEKSKFIIVK